MTPQTLQLSKIRTDRGTQVRCVITTDIVEEYAERMVDGDKFPPVDVFLDAQLDEYILADGFHRVAACQKNDFKDMLAIVHDGDRLAALEFALAANRANGLRRTNADKQHAVAMAFKEFSDRSDRKIASLVGVSHTFVASLRGQLATVASSEPRKGADGKTRKPRTPKPPTPEICESAKAPTKKEVQEATRLAKEKELHDMGEAYEKQAPVVFTPEDENPFGVDPDSAELTALKTAWTAASESDRLVFMGWLKDNGL